MTKKFTHIQYRPSSQVRVAFCSLDIDLPTDTVRWLTLDSVDAPDKRTLKGHRAHFFACAITQLEIENPYNLPDKALRQAQVELYEAIMNGEYQDEILKFIRDIHIAHLPDHLKKVGENKRDSWLASHSTYRLETKMVMETYEIGPGLTRIIPVFR
jgi:hypothetical protein